LSHLQSANGFSGWSLGVPEAMSGLFVPALCISEQVTVTVRLSSIADKRKLSKSGVFANYTVTLPAKSSLLPHYVDVFYCPKRFSTLTIRIDTVSDSLVKSLFVQRCVGIISRCCSGREISDGTDELENLLYQETQVRLASTTEQLLASMALKLLWKRRDTAQTFNSYSKLWRSP